MGRRHECKANDTGLRIEYYEPKGHWGLRGFGDGNFILYVKHCLYCGVKLEKPKPPESPDAKIGVSQKALNVWHARLFRAHADFLRGDQGHTDSDILGVLNQIGSVLDEELEPAPANVEVSREMLEKWRKTLLHLTNALDVRCPLQSGNFCEPVAYAFGDAHDVLSGINKALADINKTEEPCPQSDRE